MERLRHPSRPPDTLALVGALLAFEVGFIVIGSVATQRHGVELVPGDLEVVPRVAARATART